VKSESNENGLQHGFSWRFLIVWIATLLIVFGASAGIVMAHQIQLGRQTSELAQTVARGPHVLVMQISDGSPTRTIDSAGQCSRLC